MPWAIGRWDSIAEGANPTPLDKIPAFPQRADLIEEMMAALTAETEG